MANPLAIATQGLLAPLAALAIATGGVLAGAAPVPAEFPPPLEAAVAVERREAPVAAPPARATAVATERRAAAPQAAHARLVAPSTATRSAVVADAPARRCVVRAADRRTCTVAGPQARTCAVAIARRAAAVAQAPSRSALARLDRRAVVLRFRGEIVGRFSIFQGDTGDFDVQLLAAGAGVDVAGAAFSATWTHEDGSTGPLTFAELTPATGWVRSHFSTGDSAGKAEGVYRTRITAALLDGRVLTFPDADGSPIEFRVAKR